MKPGVSTLADLRNSWMDENSDTGSHTSFVTLNLVDFDDNTVLASITVPFARFVKSVDLAGNLWELRSCDCKQHIDHIPKCVYISDLQLSNYVYDRKSLHQYIFKMVVRPM